MASPRNLLDLSDLIGPKQSLPLHYHPQYQDALKIIKQQNSRLERHWQITRKKDNQTWVGTQIEACNMLDQKGKSHYFSALLSSVESWQATIFQRTQIFLPKDGLEEFLPGHCDAFGTHFVDKLIFSELDAGRAIPMSWHCNITWDSTEPWIWMQWGELYHLWAAPFLSPGSFTQTEQEGRNWMKKKPWTFFESWWTIPSLALDGFVLLQKELVYSFGTLNYKYFKTLQQKVKAKLRKAVSSFD